MCATVHAPGECPGAELGGMHTFHGRRAYVHIILIAHILVGLFYIFALVVHLCFSVYLLINSQLFTPIVANFN